MLLKESDLLKSLSGKPPVAPPVQKTENIYTAEEAKNVFFPDEYKQEPHEFLSQDPSLSVKVSRRTHQLPHMVSIHNPGSKPVKIEQLRLGGYRVEFKDNRYFSKNLLEYKALINYPGVICLGPQETKEKEELSEEAKQMLET